MTDQSLGTKLDDAVRTSASDQAKSYTRYAALLERFAKKEVGFLDFSRDALDIYADAVRDVTQIGGRMANDTISTGVRKLKGIKIDVSSEGGTDGGGTVVSGDIAVTKRKPNA